MCLWSIVSCGIGIQISIVDCKYYKLCASMIHIAWQMSVKLGKQKLLLLLIFIFLQRMAGNGGKFLYFAFGSNLLGERLHISNPSAVFKWVKQCKIEERHPISRAIFFVLSSAAFPLLLTYRHFERYGLLTLGWDQLCTHKSVVNAINKSGKNEIQPESVGGRPPHHTNAQKKVAENIKILLQGGRKAACS